MRRLALLLVAVLVAAGCAESQTGPVVQVPANITATGTVTEVTRMMANPTVVSDTLISPCTRPRYSGLRVPGRCKGRGMSRIAEVRRYGPPSPSLAW